MKIRQGQGVMYNADVEQYFGIVGLIKGDKAYVTVLTEKGPFVKEVPVEASKEVGRCYLPEKNSGS